MRKILVLLAVTAFAALGAEDMVHGHWKTGVASVCLAVANALLLL